LESKFSSIDTVLNIVVSVAGSNSPWLQTAAASYIQAQGVQWIKEQFQEGSPEHLAAHAILGCEEERRQEETVGQAL
jgi:hypothetical protein